MPKNWFTVKNDASASHAEVMIYDKIGKDWYGDDGIAAKDFNAALNDIPKDREIVCRINSPGGNVWDGMAIHDMLNRRKDRVTCRVEGLAASIASVIACAGKKTIVPKNALMMIHPPQAFAVGDSAEMRQVADKLDVHAKAIAAVYAGKTGKSQDVILAKMGEGETWMNGEDAKAYGLCDECTDEIAVMAQVMDFDFSAFRQVPAALTSKTKNEPAPKPETKVTNIMNKEKILALLKQHGVENIAADASDEVLLNALNAVVANKAEAAKNGNVPQNVIDLTQQVNAITSQLATERKTRIEAVVNGLVTECRVTAAEAPKAVARAVADESYLEELRTRPVVMPGSEPVGAGLMAVNDDVRNVLKAIKDHIVTGEANREKMVVTATARSQATGDIWRKERERLIPVLNAAATNTIDSALKRVAILNETIRAFAVRLLPLRLFSTVFSNVPLQGTDEIVVPYFALQTAASSDFTDGDGTGGTGYVFGQATSSSMKKITVNKRKYQPLDYSSNEFRRQPYFDAVRLGNLNAEKLAVDVLKDILSVVTAANFSTAAKVIPAASMSSDDIIDIKGVCNDAMWPDSGRGLIVDSAVDTALQKDPAYKLALNFGGTEVLRQGQLPTISGFSYAWMPSLPGNSENLIGFAAFVSGILSAFSPVDPASGVRAQLVAYEVATDPQTGISFNYRHWGDAQADRDFEIIEAAYGYKAGEAAAIKRITSA